MSSRKKRIVIFCDSAGGGGFDTSLQRTGAHRPCDAAAIRNWYLREPIAQPTCFGCRSPFTPERRPGAFLTAVASRSPQAGTAVAGLCLTCWTDLTPGAIASAALAVLRRNLDRNGKWLDGGWS
jgi:hypothetical protein